MIASGLLLGVRILLALMQCAYAAYASLSIWAARSWSRARPALDPDWTPSVTILKPVCGVDAEARENFLSFCRLDYPEDRLQIIFGALDPVDPALALAREIKAECPQVNIHVVNDPLLAPKGLNRKVCNISQMLPHAQHDLLILCDSDMRVTPDYVRRVVAPFQDRKTGRQEDGKTEDALNHATLENPSRKDQSSKIENRGVGLVTCPYAGFHSHSLAAVVEALGIGADFIPSTFVSRKLEGVGFALGSTIALPRRVLDEIGGFAPLVNELADDFRLGEGVRKAGYEVVLSDYVIADVLGQENWRAMWARRLRWARTTRACRPAGYAGAIVTHGFALSLLFLLACHFGPVGWAGVGMVLALRLFTAAWIARVYTRDPNIGRFLPLLPLSDLLSFALFVASFCGNRIVWRGMSFRLRSGGKLEAL